MQRKLVSRMSMVATVVCVLVSNLLSFLAVARPTIRPQVPGSRYG
jgi:hypothetical protein